MPTIWTHELEVSQFDIPSKPLAKRGFISGQKERQYVRRFRGFALSSF
jgi:hypothetical protein